MNEKRVYLQISDKHVKSIGPFEKSVAFWTDDGDCIILDLLTLQRGLECHKVTYEQKGTREEGNS